MGHPKGQKKKYARPFRPFDRERLQTEKKIMQDFGLRRKHEIWRAQSILRNFRRRARELQAKQDEQKKKELFEKLNKIGLLSKEPKLENVLEIKLEDILSRRLQTLVYKKGISNTPKGARQIIVHKHIIIDNRKIPWPGYFVPTDLEDKIGLDPKIKLPSSEKVKS